MVAYTYSIPICAIYPHQQNKNQKKLQSPQQVVFRKPADYSKAAVYKCKPADYSKAAVYKL